jgi:hypothetical protein
MDEISKGTSPTGRRVISGATAALALLLAACGTQTIAGLPSPDPALMSYEWQLPSLDLTGSGPDGAVYQALQKSCDAGANALAQQWAQTSGPRTVLLFAAGAELCRGQLGAARIYYNRAHGEYGWGDWHQCRAACRAASTSPSQASSSRRRRSRFNALPGRIRASGAQRPVLLIIR